MKQGLRNQHRLAVDKKITQWRPRGPYGGASVLARAGLLLAWLALGVAVHARAQATISPSPPVMPGDVEIRTSYWVPTGASWDLHITREGYAYWSYRAGYTGQADGRFHVGKDDLATMLNTGALKDFESLPDSMSPRIVPIHFDNYDIAIRTPHMRHTVRVGNPVGLTDSPELTRFRVAWNAIWAKVPFRPPPMPAASVLPEGLAPAIPPAPEAKQP